jgi:hypothetical protein
MACDAQPTCLRCLKYVKDMDSLRVLCSACNAKLHMVCEGILLPEEAKEIDGEYVCRRYAVFAR